MARIDDAIWGETTYRYDVGAPAFAEAKFGDGLTEKFDYDAAKNVAGVSLQDRGRRRAISRFERRRLRT